jgi:hypothetical protein
MGELYVASRNYDMLGFWNNVCKDKSVRELMLKYSSARKKRSCGDDDDVLALRTARERLEGMRGRVEEDLTTNVADAADELFATGTKLGTQELSGQRVLQVATIVRNLSFEEDNALVLARNMTLLRSVVIRGSLARLTTSQLFSQVLPTLLQHQVEQSQPDGL